VAGPCGNSYELPFSGCPVRRQWLYRLFSPASIHTTIPLEYANCCNTPGHSADIKPCVCTASLRPPSVNILSHGQKRLQDVAPESCQNFAAAPCLQCSKSPSAQRLCLTPRDMNTSPCVFPGLGDIILRATRLWRLYEEVCSNVDE
jgi:hypothetical protein